MDKNRDLVLASRVSSLALIYPVVYVQFFLRLYVPTSRTSEGESYAACLQKLVWMADGVHASVASSMVVFEVTLALVTNAESNL